MTLSFPVCCARFVTGYCGLSDTEALLLLTAATVFLALKLTFILGFFTLVQFKTKYFVAFFASKHLPTCTLQKWHSPFTSFLIPSEKKFFLVASLTSLHRANDFFIG
jgi:hypothetical protein